MKGAETVSVELRAGIFVIVDAADAHILTSRSWYPHGTAPHIYAATTDGKKTQHLHRLLMGNPPGMHVDHKDGNTLNCSRANLRVCTPRQNSLNRRKTPGHTSQYLGVSWHANAKWQSKITCNGKLYFLGLFTSEKAAALAYNRAARRLFGEFANLNDVRAGEARMLDTVTAATRALERALSIMGART